MDGWFLECFDGNEQPPQSEEFWGTLAEISAMFRSSRHCCVFFINRAKVITATFLCNVDGAGTDPAFKSISQAMGQWDNGIWGAACSLCWQNFLRHLQIFTSSNVARCSLSAVGVVKQCLEIACKFTAWNGWNLILRPSWWLASLPYSTGRCLSILPVLM